MLIVTVTYKICGSHHFARKCGARHLVCCACCQEHRGDSHTALPSYFRTLLHLPVRKYELLYRAVCSSFLKRR